jgi:hypothetical protein
MQASHWGSIQCLHSVTLWKCGVTYWSPPPYPSILASFQYIPCWYWPSLYHSPIPTFAVTFLNHPIIHSDTQDHIPILFYHHPMITITFIPSSYYTSTTFALSSLQYILSLLILTAPTNTDDCSILHDPDVSSLCTLSKCVYEAWATS